MELMIKIKPEIVFRNEEHYAAITNKLKREDIPSVLPPLIPELFNWLKEKKIKFAGAPFFSYLNMNNEQLEVEVGIPTHYLVKGDRRVQQGTFPAGKYAVAKYTGPYNKLFEVNVAIEKWKDENHIKFKKPKVEFYPTDPAAEPNPEKWETIIINRIDEN
jgi:effector-binding domain-containing protein